MKLCELAGSEGQGKPIAAMGSRLGDAPLCKVARLGPLHRVRRVEARLGEEVRDELEEDAAFGDVDLVRVALLANGDDGHLGRRVDLGGIPRGLVLCREEGRAGLGQRRAGVAGLGAVNQQEATKGAD